MKYSGNFSFYYMHKNSMQNYKETSENAYLAKFSVSFEKS